MLSDEREAIEMPSGKRNYSILWTENKFRYTPLDTSLEEMLQIREDHNDIRDILIIPADVQMKEYRE